MASEVKGSAKVAKDKQAKTTDKSKVVKARTKPNHPPVSTMVMESIKSLKDRKGSTLQAIKKHMTATYLVDCSKLAPFIKKFVKSAVADEKLIQTKGHGASGSFKLPAAIKGEKKVAKKASEKPAAKKTTSMAKKGTPTKLKKPVAKTLKTATPKKPSAKKPAEIKKVVAKKPAADKKSAPKKLAEAKKSVAKKPVKAAKASASK